MTWGMPESGAHRRDRSENGGMEKTASDFLKVPEAARALGVSERTIRSWIATGHLAPPARRGAWGDSD
jgi:predicted DNA-binding transcriptional regulator AlpA